MMKYAILFLIFILAFFGWIYFRTPNDFPAGTIVTVPEGATLNSVTNELYSSHIIRTPFFFKLAVYMEFGQKHIVAGDYLMDKKEGSVDIAYRLVHGKFHIQPVKLTFPEGWTVLEISDYVSKNISKFNSREFLSLAKNKEGYLFPDTYLVSPIITPENLIKRMQDNYAIKIASLQNQIFSSGHTKLEIVTMASILEGEAKTETDKLIVSGILWKRLSLNMPLQVDAKRSTYSQIGLPAAPINNPGLVAIEAALNPTKTYYLYYISDKNGNLHYAKTLAEHEKNIAKYLK